MQSEGNEFYDVGLIKMPVVVFGNVQVVKFEEGDQKCTLTYLKH